MSGTTAAPQESSYDAAEEFLERRTPAQRIQTTLHQYPWLSPAVVLVISVIVFGMLNSKFATPNNLSLITQQVAVVGALAVGQTLIILTAGHRPVLRRHHGLLLDGDGQDGLRLWAPRAAGDPARPCRRARWPAG